MSSLTLLLNVTIKNDLMWKALCVCTWELEDFVPDIMESNVMGQCDESFKRQDKTDPDVRNLRIQRGFMEEAALSWTLKKVGCQETKTWKNGRMRE